MRHFGVSPFGRLFKDVNHLLGEPFRQDISSENPCLEHAVLLPDVMGARHSVPEPKLVPVIARESQEVSFGRFNDSVCDVAHSLILWGRKSGRRPVATWVADTTYTFLIGFKGPP